MLTDKDLSEMEKFADSVGHLHAPDAKRLIDEVRRLRGQGVPPGRLCCVCKAPILGRMYYQGGSRDHPIHKGCRIEIRGPRRAE